MAVSFSGSSSHNQQALRVDCSRDKHGRMPSATTLAPFIPPGTYIGNAPDRYSFRFLQRGRLVEVSSRYLILAASTGSRSLQCHVTAAILSAGRTGWPSSHQCIIAASPIPLLPNSPNLMTQVYLPCSSHSHHIHTKLRVDSQPVAAICCTASVIDHMSTRHWPDGIRLLEVSEDPEIWAVSALRADSHYETQSHVRYVDSFKHRFAQQEFHSLRQRIRGGMGRSVECVCLAAVIAEHECTRGSVAMEGGEDKGTAETTAGRGDNLIAHDSRDKDSGGGELSGRGPGGGEEEEEGGQRGRHTGRSSVVTIVDNSGGSSSDSSSMSSATTRGSASTTFPRAALQVVGSLDVSVRTLGSNEILPGVEVRSRSLWTRRRQRGKEGGISGRRVSVLPAEPSVTEGAAVSLPLGSGVQGLGSEPPSRQPSREGASDSATSQSSSSQAVQGSDEAAAAEGAVSRVGEGAVVGSVGMLDEQPAVRRDCDEGTGLGRLWFIASDAGGGAEAGAGVQGDARNLLQSTSDASTAADSPGRLVVHESISSSSSTTTTTTSGGTVVGSRREWALPYITPSHYATQEAASAGEGILEEIESTGLNTGGTAAQQGAAATSAGGSDESDAGYLSLPLFAPIALPLPLRPKPPRPARVYAYISNVCVAERSRRRGIAAALMREAMGRVEQWGYSVVYVHVHACNTGAIRLYRELGYKVVDLKNLSPEYDLIESTRQMKHLDGTVLMSCHFS